MRRRRRLRWVILLLLPPTLALLLWIRLLPTVEAMAVAQAEDVASNLIADTIYAQMELDGITYDSFIRLELDSEGQLLALRTDMRQMNRLRNETLANLNWRLLGKDSTQLGIPIGNVVIPALFSGKGPTLPVRFLTVSNAGAEFHSSFQAAGINQTLHQITMEVSLDLTLMTSAGVQSTHVDSGVVVAETVLLGDVPLTMIRSGETE